MTGPAPGLFSSGLQPERTHLAWSRTGLGFLVNAALLVRFAEHARPPALAYAAAVVMGAGGIAISVLGRLSYPRRNRALAAGRSIAAPALLRGVWLTLTIGAVGATAATVSALLAGS